MALSCGNFDRVFNRRDLLKTSSAGFGSLALASLFQQTTNAASRIPQHPHHAATAKRVIFLFMHGGPSQVDTFDYKPKLTRDNGKPIG